MSIKAMHIIWEKAPYDGNTLLTLLALADRADDDGVCWPSVDTLAKKTRQSERNVQYCLAKMSKDGFLNRTFRRSTSTMYKLALDKLNKLPDAKIAPLVTTGDEQACTEGCKTAQSEIPSLAPNTSRTTSDTSESQSLGEPAPQDSLTLTSKPDKETRHQDTLDYFFKAFCRVNEVQDMPNMKALTANLKMFLRDHPIRSYPQQRINNCIDSWAQSHPKWHTFAKPWTIILALEKFSKGALDEYGAQIGVTLDKAAVKNHDQAQRLATELDYIASLSTRQHGNKL